ncbi:MAG: hypothetical protein ACYTGZ_12105 [Planctomycetota bacterium]
MIVVDEYGEPRPRVRVLPSLLGITLAAVPVLLWIFLAPCLLVLWLGTPLPLRVRPSASQKRARLASLFVIVAAVGLCLVSPKHLDREVGPAQYQDVPLSELCTRLDRDHGIRCSVDDGLGQGRIDFEIPHPMSRREVLRKLAEESGLDLWLDGCGTGATILWGVHYSPQLIDPLAH